MARTTPTYTPIRNYAIGFFLSAFLLFSDINYESFSELRGTVKAATLYVKLYSNRFLHNIGDIFSSFQESNNLIQENTNLREEINRIKTQNSSKNIETLQRSKMLDSFKDLVEKFDNNIDIHKIASIDLKNYLCCSSHKIFLQNPQKIQIKENLPVLAGGSFIGQTSKQYLNLIEVILFSDSNHVLPVKSDVFYCNARGMGKPLLISCSPKINIKDLGSKIGDSIYTSGLGGIFIKDTKIGFISDISLDSAGEIEVVITLLGNPLEENFYGIIGNLEDEA
tara:strand:- start:70 stop:909 length:840 start_codon:yes stop_codon:yes gene_type:complete